MARGNSGSTPRKPRVAPGHRRRGPQPRLERTSCPVAGGCSPAAAPPALRPPHPPSSCTPEAALHSAFPCSFSRAHPGLSRRGRGAFRSPRPSPKVADGAPQGSLHLDVERLKEQSAVLEREIAQLLSEGCCVEELDEHISQLHEYNDIKDVGQMLLGKLAVIRGVTTKELYPEFDLDLSD